MAVASNVNSKRMYSWWWDSHISPKNSKWLQENLTDMDVKVKQMIRLIEEDADSFARRAEMYYKKRPELTKLVEEFYRAYRALAERYDHATGVLRQAHRTMAEAFPNQVPLMLADDITSSPAETDPRTPDMSPHARAFFDPSNFDAVTKNENVAEELDSATGRKVLKQFNNFVGSREAATHAKFSGGQARKGLVFHDVGEKESSVENNVNHDNKVQVPSESERVAKAETEISNFRKALAKLEAEKEAGLLQYQQSLERLSNLESEFSRAREDSQGLNDRASKAEGEVQSLKEALIKLEAEREASLLQYQHCLDKISNLENSISSAQKDVGELNQRASKAETEADSLKQDLARAKAEKESLLAQYNKCLEVISKLEENLQRTEEDAKRIKERANEVESEIEYLKQEIAKLTEEKEAAALQYQKCLERICELELKISCAQEEAERLNRAIDDRVEKLKNAGERCLLLEETNQTLQSKLESLVQMVESQSEELTEKQKELGRLWTSIQEERLRFMEAETAFQTLQHLHSQSQEELRSLAAELHNQAKLVHEMKTRTHVLEDEVHKVNEENKVLNEVNLSSELTIKNLQDEMLNLRETIKKLEEEVELRVDQRNALQQEIYCLKEELNDLNRKHHGVLEQIESIGFDPESVGSSIMKLQEENTKIKELCETERNEKVVLLEKMEIMNILLEKNAFLENSLSDLNVELEGVRGKVKELEESCQSLLGEKSALFTEKSSLISQLNMTTANMDTLSEKNNLLEVSLSDVNAELEGLRVKVKSLEDSCSLLDNEKSSLTSEREMLVSQLDLAQKTLEIREKRCSELEQKHFVLERERGCALHRVEELLFSFNCAKEEHSKFVQLSESQLSDQELHIRLLQEEGECKKKEYEGELDKAVNAQIEIFVLQKCLKDLEEKNFSLFMESQQLSEASKMSAKLISRLEDENLQHKVHMKTLSENNKMLWSGLFQVLEALDVDAKHLQENLTEQDKMLSSHINHKLKEAQALYLAVCNENQGLVVEKSVLLTLLWQLKVSMENLVAERDALDEKFTIQTEQYLELQDKARKFSEKNEELQLRKMEQDQKVDVLTTEIENKHRQLLDFEGTHMNLQEESHKISEERRSLMEEVLSLSEEKSNLEEELKLMFGELVSQVSHSLVYENIAMEKLSMLQELIGDLDKLFGLNSELEKRLGVMVGELEEAQLENSHLKESLEKSNAELRSFKSLKDQLNCEIGDREESLSMKENELLGAKEMLGTLQNEKTELQKMVQDLKSKYDEAKLINEDQETQIFKMSLEKDHLDEEFGYLCEVNQKMKFEMANLLEELEEAKIREHNLRSELQDGRNEIGQWENQAATYFGQLQISAVNETLLEGKIHELTDSCQDLECKSISEGIEIEQLKDKISHLEGDKGRLNDHLEAYIPAVSSLKDCITSLEKQALVHSKSYSIHNGDLKDDTSVSHLHSEYGQGIGGDKLPKDPDALLYLLGMQKRIAVIQRAMMDMQRLAELKNMQDTAKLEDAVKEIQELKSEITLHEKHIRRNSHAALTEEARVLKDRPINEQKMQDNEVLTKDIMLDQISDCSSFGLGRRGTIEADNRLLELWDTTNDRDDSIDLTVGKTRKVAAGASNHYPVESIKEQKSEHLSTESLVEKELSVDKLEISSRFSMPREGGSKTKVLERLDSDAQKLANLQITVHDLKRKVEITEKSKKGKNIENDSVKVQLEDAEETIMKLFDANRKLMKNIEDGSVSYDGNPAIESEESGSISRRRVSDIARKGSERIGRLQLEIQRIQFLLLKLEDEKLRRGKTKIIEKKPRVLLRDYLYGGGRRTHQKQKKAPFCSCVRPPTKGD